MGCLLSKKDKDEDEDRPCSPPGRSMGSEIPEPGNTTQFGETTSHTVHSDEFSTPMCTVASADPVSMVKYIGDTSSSLQSCEDNCVGEWGTVLTDDESSPRQLSEDLTPPPKRNKVTTFLKPPIPSIDGRCESPDSEFSEPMITPTKAQKYSDFNTDSFDSNDNSPLKRYDYTHIGNSSPWSESTAGDSFDSADSICSQPSSYEDEFERLYDRDNTKMSYNRFLKTRRVRRLIKSNAMTRESVHGLYCIYDKDNDGEIDVTEYVELMDIINMSYEEHINAVELSDNEDEIHNMPGGNTPKRILSLSPAYSPPRTNMSTLRSSLNNQMLARLAGGNYSLAVSISTNQVEPKPESAEESVDRRSLFTSHASSKKGFLLKIESSTASRRNSTGLVNDAVSLKENRFFTLDDGVLTYYDHITNTQGLLKRDIVLKDAKLNIESHNTFEIRHANSSRLVSLEVKSIKERDEWVAAIMEHIQISSNSS
jgi:hypothetical protein